MSESEERSFGLLLPFDTDEADFIRGFEAGYVWGMLHYDDEREFTVHATNAEMMIRIAEARGLRASSVADDDKWIAVTFEDSDE